MEHKTGSLQQDFYPIGLADNVERDGIMLLILILSEENGQERKINLF